MELSRSESVSFDTLLAGPREHLKTMAVTVASGQNLKRGAIVTYASGKVSAVTKATDTVFGILMEDVDAEGADTDGMVYLNGEFNQDALSMGTPSAQETVADFMVAARNVGIIFRKPAA